MAFITNEGKDKNLGIRLKELIEISSELKFLSGYFYFTGIKELYEALKDNPDVILKILVGLEVDKAAYGLIEYGSNEKLSSSQKIDKYLQSIKMAINSQEFDNKEFYEQAQFFIKMLEEGRLIIRKTNNSNHAKLYIFKLRDNKLRSAVFITGSSNLTRSGLVSQEELNVEISDFGVKDVEEYFDKQWEKAVKVSEDNVKRKRLIETLTKETFLRQITPYEAYTFVLKNYLDTYIGQENFVEKLLESSGYKPYKYQVDAIKQALSIIEQNNGVILGDVVGLGKSVIASAVAFLLNKKGIIIAPPGLVGDEYATSGWKKYIKDFGLDKLGWDVFSIGKLENVLEYVKDRNVEAVIVDEAHRFRNQDTKRYELLRNICRGKTVILLTATPFNNRPSDIFSLLKLFIVPKKSAFTFRDNLEQIFDEYQSIFDKLSYITKYHNSKDYTKIKKVKDYYKSLFNEYEIDITKVKNKAREIAKKIRTYIEPVIIRRNRLDLQENPNYRDEVKEIPKLENPQEWFFELKPEQLKFYDDVINQYFAYPSDDKDNKDKISFKGAIYMPYAYEIGLAESEKLMEEDSDASKEEVFRYYQQLNLYNFIRRLLVKRFESSFGSFKKSIENFKDTTEKALEFIERTNKYILDRQLLEKIYDDDPEEIEEKLRQYFKTLEKKEKEIKSKSRQHDLLYDLSKFKDRDRFIADIKSDIKLFTQILKELDQLKLTENDPKLDKLIDGLREKFKDNPNRKVVVFSEYIDTIKHIEGRLMKEFNNRVLSVAGDLTKDKISQIYRNFDASYNQQENSYDILLATDKISEGFNLNRAGMVINYDIPWNPVRVIQRVGRINRIGKKVFDKLYIVNFFPTEIGADKFKSREIAKQKMFYIHNVLGEDAKIFDVDEEPSASKLYKRLLENPEKLEEESLYTKLLKEFKEIEKKDPSLIERLKSFPQRVKVAKKSDKDELFVVVRKGRNLHILHTDYENQPEIKSLEEVIDRIRSSPDEKAIGLSSRFWQAYEDALKEAGVQSRYRENSLEAKAHNNLKTMLKKKEFEPYRSFITTLIEDILHYGTLSDYTLRRIAQIKADDKGIKEIGNLMKELGENYLEEEEKRMKHLTKDIVISIENRQGGWSNEQGKT